MTERLEALNAAKSSMEFWRNDDVKCPHCGANHDPYLQEWFHLYEEERHDVICPTCERDFIVTTHAVYSFSTDEQDDD